MDTSSVKAEGMMDPKSTIRNFIKMELAGGAGAPDIGDQDSLIEAGVIDSLGIQKLLAFLESQFSIKLRDEDIVPENFDTVENITRLVHAKA